MPGAPSAPGTPGTLGSLDTSRLQGAQRAARTQGSPDTQLNRLEWQGAGRRGPLSPLSETGGAANAIDARAANTEPLRSFTVAARTPRHPIPDRIETFPSHPSDGDALAALSIAGGLRVMDGSDAALQLAAIRTDGARLRIQLQARGGNTNSAPSSGWLETGDSTAGGWMVLSISNHDALLLSPRGNPYRLRLRPRSADVAKPSMAPSPATRAAPDPRTAP
jgi:hypothetical protein